MNPQSGFQVYADAASLAEAAARQVVETIRHTLTHQPRCAVALSGGTTPREAYARLAQPDLAAQVDWARVHFFWSDERCVPPDHTDSNYHMAREALLDQIPLPGHNAHRLRGELEPDQAAAAYQTELRDFFRGPWPRFDLILLGLGEDGHTASLFPGTAALNETERWAVANYVPRLQSWRLTLTLPVINQARQIVFLVSGAGKAAILREVSEGAQHLPAQLIQPETGQLLWLLDAAAAQFLSPPAK